MTDPGHVLMIRRDLRGLDPHSPLPPEITARAHRPGDEDAWRSLQEAADEHNTFSEDTFAAQFGTDDQEHARRILYLEDRDTGRLIGTAAAWTGEGPWADWGRVHWVAIHPDWQGRRLSYPLMQAALHRLAELGHTRAYLTTSRKRPAALTLYRNLGFVECESIEG